MQVPRQQQRALPYLERLLRQVPFFRALPRAAECELFAELELPEPVLDVGCGDGTFVQALAPAGRWIGIDPDVAPLGVAQSLGAYSALAVSAGGRLPFRDAAFGSVISNSTLEHIPDVEPVLAEMCRVLRPGGAFVVSFPSERFFDLHFGVMAAERLCVRPAASAYRALMRRIARVHHADPPALWRERLERMGLTVESWRYYFDARSTAMMDIGHYASGPSLLTHVVLKRWVLWPGKVRFLPIATWLEPFARPGAADDGAFLLFVCRKPEPSGSNAAGR